MKSIKDKISDYSEDKSKTIGLANLESLRKGKGELKFNGVYIHLAPICNFRCIGCFSHIENVICDRLRFQTIKRVVDYAHDHGSKSIIFAGAGEPTLDTEYLKISNYIVQKGLQIVLFTNLSTLKTIAQAEKMLQRGPVIGKLYTLNKAKYNYITKNKFAYKYAQEGFELLIKAKNNLKSSNPKQKIILAMDAYVSRINYQDLPDLLRFCRKNDIIPYFEAFIELGQKPEIIRKYALTEKELTNIFVKLREIDKEEFGLETDIKSGSRNYGQDPCIKATHMFSVRENGDIRMCVCTLRSVGKIYNNKDPYQTLENIFSSQNKELLEYFKCDQCSKKVNNKYL